MELQIQWTVIDNKMKLLIIFLIIITSLTSEYKAETWVITSKNSKLAELTEAQCKLLWLGDLDMIAGSRIFVVDQFTAVKVRERFYQNVAGMSKQQLQIYWAKKIFANGSFPPESKPNDEEVIKWVQQEKNRIGYINSESFTSEVKILYMVKDKQDTNDNN